MKLEGCSAYGLGVHPGQAPIATSPFSYRYKDE